MFVILPLNCYTHRRATLCDPSSGPSSRLWYCLYCSALIFMILLWTCAF